MLPPAYAQSSFSGWIQDYSIPSPPPDSRINQPLYSDPFGDIGDSIDLPLLPSYEDISKGNPVPIPDPVDTSPPPKPEALVTKDAPVPKDLPPEISIPKGFYVSLRAGIPNALGLELGADVHNNLRLRASTQFLFYTLKFIDTNNTKNDISLSAFLLWPEIMMDIYPVAQSSFRISIGAAYVGHVIELGRDADPFNRNASDDSIEYTFSNIIAPSIGLGWDFGRQKSSGFIGSIDFGASWVGKPKATRVLKGPPNSLNDDAYERTLPLIQKYGVYAQFLPWIGFSMGYKF